MTAPATAATPSQPAPPGGPGGLRRNRSFQIILGGQFVSGLGDQIARIAVPWVVYDLTGSASQMGAISAITNLPQLIFGLPAGAYVDRLNRRRLLIGGDVACALIIAMIPLLMALGAIRVWQLAALIFLLQVVVVFYFVALQASLPNIVARQDLAAANSWLHLSDSTVGLVGPTLAGALIAAIGIAPALGVDVLTFGASMLSVLVVAIPQVWPKDRGARRSLWADVFEGLRFLWRETSLRLLVLVLMGVNVGVSAYMGLLVFHLRHNLAWSPTQVGAVFSAAGFASLIVAPLVPALGKRFRRGAVVTAGLVVAGLAGPLVGFGRSLWLVAGAWAALAIASGIVNVLLVTLRQQIVPNELLGRVMSSSRFLARLAVPPTMWLAGLGGDAFGAPVVLAAAGVFILLVAAGGAAFGLGRLK